VEGAKQLGIPVAKDTLLSDPVTLVYEGSDTFVLRLPNRTIVQLNRDMTSGAIRKAGRESGNE
jgi:hypothetical protein